MTAIPFDVNDRELRSSFFAHRVLDAVDSLTEQSPALWGKMSAQHMVEHLIWSFRYSTGGLDVPCRTPEKLLERAKRFLHDSRQMPQLFKNPLLGEEPPPLELACLADAKVALRREIDCFQQHFQEEPGALHVHPVFGPLNAEEWQRSHFKHCYHHLLQFGLINGVC